MNKYWALLIYVPFLFPHDYFMDLSPWLRKTIAEWVVYDNDFNKAFSNFKSLKNINTMFHALMEKRRIKYHVLSAALDDDLEMVIPKITKLMVHQSFKSIKSDDTYLCQPIYYDLRPKVANFFANLVQLRANVIAPEQQKKADNELYLLVTELIIGTSALIESVEKEINNKDILLFDICALITYTPREKWQKCLPVYLRILKSLDQMHFSTVDTVRGDLYDGLFIKAIQFNDRPTIKEILTIKKNFDITFALDTCISGFKNWRNVSDIIQIMLSLSNEFDTDYIHSTLYKLVHKESNKFNQSDLKELMNQIKDIDYEKRHPKRIKLT